MLEKCKGARLEDGATCSNLFLEAVSKVCTFDFAKYKISRKHFQYLLLPPVERKLPQLSHRMKPPVVFACCPPV